MSDKPKPDRCICGHAKSRHEHIIRGTHCSAHCACEMYRPYDDSTDVFSAPGDVRA